MPKKEKNLGLINERLDMARDMCQNNRTKLYNEKGERLWDGVGKDLKRLKNEREKTEKFRKNMWNEMKELSKDTGMDEVEFYMNFLLSRQLDEATPSRRIYELLKELEQQG